MIAEYLIVTLVVCSILAFHYFIFGVKIEKEKKEQQERREEFFDFISQNVTKLDTNLVGLETDELKGGLYITESQAIYGIKSSEISKLRITLKDD